MFDFNGGNGLEVIVGDCNISLTGVTADKNGEDGAKLDNTATTGDIEVSNSIFGDSGTGGNGMYGLEALSNGTITLTDVTADDNGVGGVYKDGIYLDTSGDATVICSTANDNHGYGLQGTIDGVFTNGLTTNNGINVAGYSAMINSVCHSGGGGKGGSTTVSGPGPLPWHVVNVSDSSGQGSQGGQGVIPVSGSAGVGLDCTQYSGTDLVLPNGDEVLMPCPIGSTPGTTGSLNRVTNENLPGKLDGKFTFVSSLDAEVNPSLTGGMMTVSFKIPAGEQGSNFTILHWDGSKWVSLGGFATPPGYFSVSTNLTGDFVLVTQ